MVGDSLPSPLSFFYLYFNTSISFFICFYLFYLHAPHFYFFIFSIFLLPHFSRCVVVHVGGLYVICQLSVCSPIGM